MRDHLFDLRNESERLRTVIQQMLLDELTHLCDVATARPVIRFVDVDPRTLLAVLAELDNFRLADQLRRRDDILRVDSCPQL